MSGEERIQQIHEANQAYNAALEVYNKANFPLEWAMTQDNMGQALYDMATLLDGPKEYGLLKESIEAFHKALEIYTQERTESAWRSAQYHLGISLHSLSRLENRKERSHLLIDPIHAFHPTFKGLHTPENS